MKAIRNSRSERRWQLIGLFGKWAIDVIGITARTRIIGEDKVRSIMASRRFILAFWHSRILLTSYMHKGWDGMIMTSRSGDGEIIARIVQRQGHEPVRGSTGKGGLRALARFIKRLKAQDMPGGMIPDGPQGPRYRVQPGIITLAQKTGYPIIPASYSGRKIKVFNSWDRFILPYPFTRCHLVYGEPVWVPLKADKKDLEACRLVLEQEMRRITFTHDRHFGHVIR